jgi:phosphoribosylglycinamide formyltransferase 2
MGEIVRMNARLQARQSFAFSSISQGGSAQNDSAGESSPNRQLPEDGATTGLREDSGITNQWSRWRVDDRISPRVDADLRAMAHPDFPMTSARGGRGVVFRDSVGTPEVGEAPCVLLLGSGELGREIAIEAMRLGAEVVAADRYAHAPAMQVAHRSRVLTMTDPGALRSLVEEVRPDVIVPEIEQIATAELVRLEEEGWTVIPNATAARTTMDRERIRVLAAETARVPTSRFAFSDNLNEARASAQKLGFPCVFKAIMSSSGHGMTVVHSAAELDRAYADASEHGRVANPRIMIEEFLRFDVEVTMLAVRHYDEEGRPRTSVMAPIGHARPGTLFHESWQPADLPLGIVQKLERVSVAVTDALGGFGVFGVECFVVGDSVYFSEVSPRPHDTGLVTLGSQWNSEFALHARAILGLPYVGPEPTVAAAAHVILASETGVAPLFGNLSKALAEPGVRIFLFGKPEGYPDRRLGVAVARGATVAEARKRAETSAHLVERQIAYAPRAPGSPSG